MAPAAFTAILVGTDFSSCSAAAVAQAVRIGSRCGAGVRVVHVIDMVVVAELESALASLDRNVRGVVVEDAERAWTAFAGSIPGAAGLPIEIVVGHRLAGILSYAAGGRAYLLVLGALGDRAADVGTGTVATACVRKSAADVLLVRDSRPGQRGAPFRTILAGVDFSPTSLLAVERAASLAAMDGALLHLLHAFQPPWRQLHYRSPTPLAPVHLQKQYRDGLDRRLLEFCRPALAAHPGLPHLHTVVECSGHRSGIVEHATSVDADLMVLGTRGRTNLRDVLLGSTAEKALRETRCSVLAVKPRDGGE